jgi:hypothetical protein
LEKLNISGQVSLRETPLEMPQMTSPDGGLRGLGSQDSQPRTGEEFGLKKRVLRHQQPGKRSAGDLWPAEYQEKRCGKRRQRCSEECEEFMTVHSPIVENACQRQISADHRSTGSLRRYEKTRTSQGTLPEYLLEAQAKKKKKRCRQVN